jgi:hypothetical protein
MNAPQFLSRGIDYLGDLGAKLRDLQGFKTLANELVQNADDVKTGVTKMIFNVSDDALIVDNDGVFSDCGHIELDECPWKEDSAIGHRCDFHRFRYVASGDKRGEEGTTGAFGIGFIAAYQITDQPELISAGRHWILHEDRPENERIQVCSGCAECTGVQLPRTRFILPWAKDPESILRNKLNAQALAAQDIDALFDELDRSLLPSMLFLKRLRAIELQRNGKEHRIFQRLDEGKSMILTDGQPARDRVWHILEGDFSNEAEGLRARHPGRIEPKRSSRVIIAIPQENECRGLFCVCLPTEQESGFPFHINADFFPSNDRKRLNLSAGFEAEWNRVAIRAAAKTLAHHLERLPALLGHQSLWGLLDSIKKVSDEAAKPGREPALAAFWEDLSPRLQTAPVIFTTLGEWAMPSQCCLLLQKEETAAIPLLERLGMKIVNEALRPYQALLRSEAVGVPVLGIPVLCQVLTEKGFDVPLETQEWQNQFSEPNDLKTLWAEISLLRNRDKRTPNVRAAHDDLLKKLSIAPVQGNKLVPCQEAYHADPSTVALFSQIDPETPFLSEDPDFEPLRDLCPPFNATAAIGALDSIESDGIAHAWKEARLDLKRLFEWFEKHRQEILEHHQVKQSLSDLAIFPCSGRLQKMAALALPGDFNDPLGLAEIVDLIALGGRRDFLRDLGMPALDFKTYAVRLPDALSNLAIPADKRRKAVFLLAERIGEIKDNPSIRDGLAGVPLVECTDGTFQKATACYFPNESVKLCLGESVLTAVIPSSQAAACQGLYEWLGVASRPRIPDLLKRIQRIAGNSYAADHLHVITTIISHLGQRFRDKDPPSELEVLQNLSWLPARGKTEGWHKPNELFAVFQDYLFETQALFLDIPRNIQNTASDILQYLGVRTTPETGLVVKHLLHSGQKNLSVHQEVYRFLNDKADDPALLQLQGNKCLYLKEQKCYLPPDQVFWGEHPFGRYRHRLDENLRVYGNLFKKLGVRDGPDHTDAIAVLKEFAATFGAANQPLDEQDHAVVLACWRLLESAIGTGSFSEKETRPLQGMKCVPNGKRMLNPPEWMFFENRAGLAEKFGTFLTANVIPKPVGVGRAMAMAGVRPLGAAVKVQLLECDDPVRDGDLANRIHERHNAFARILDAQIPSDTISSVLERLSNIRFDSARSLMIRYQLHAFNRVLESKPESTPALYLSDEARLIFTNSNGWIVWPAIARELAVAMLPEHDPGSIAAGIKEVLSAESAGQADRTLDELGYPRLDTMPPPQPPAIATISGLGTNEPTGDTVDPGTATGKEGPDGRRPMTPGQAVETLLGPDAPQPGPPPGETSPEPVTGETTGRGQKQKRETQRNKRPVLRSYIPSPDAGLEATGETGENARRSPVDEAGVGRVLDYEKACGRCPKEMPHTNPGYDIESRDAEGRILRYIEVKSLSGAWAGTYAVLSKPQFDAAKRLGDAFWLYVVDQAQTDGFAIHRIQNPAQRANHFMFDDGWQAMKETDETIKESQEESG